MLAMMTAFLQQMTTHARRTRVRPSTGPGISVLIIAVSSTLESSVVDYGVGTGTKQIVRGGARWLSGSVSDSGAKGRGFETYRRRVVSLSKTLYSPKVLVNYPGSGGSVPT